MKAVAITIFLSAASLAPLCASVTMNIDIGNLRDSSGAVIVNTTTLYAIVYDTNNDSSMPGGIGVNESLTDADISAAFAAFAGKTLYQGLEIGSDTVVKWGTFNDPDGVASLGLSTEDFESSGITETVGHKYGFYWFPGVSTAEIPSNLMQVGGINETVDYVGTGANFIGMQIPSDGSIVTTGILHTSLGGEVADTDRFTAIVVPEPSTFVLVALAALGLLRRSRV